MSIEYNIFLSRINSTSDRIDSIDWGGYSELRADLRKLSKEIISSDMPGNLKKSTFDMTSSLFSRLDTFRDSFFKEQEKHYHFLKSEISDWKKSLDLKEIKDRQYAWENSKRLSNLVKDTEIKGKNGFELRVLVNECFELLNSNRLKKVFSKHEREEYMKSFEPLRSVHFSQFSIPERDYEPNENLRIPNLNYKIPLERLLDMHSNVFKFSGDRKPEFRKEQMQYAIMCYEGITAGRDVVIEGPTGLGKTRALIWASLPYLLENNNHRLIYTTRTTTQVNSVVEDLKEILPGIQEIDATIFLGTVRLKNSILECYSSNSKNADQDSQDTENQCIDCIKYETRWEIKNTKFLSNQVLGNDELIEASRDNQCPIGLMFKKAKRSRIIVMPQQYLYDSDWMV